MGVFGFLSVLSLYCILEPGSRNQADRMRAGDRYECLVAVELGQDERQRREGEMGRGAWSGAEQ